MSQRSRIITLSVLSILIVACLVLGITYSFMQANIDSDSVTEVSLSSCAKVTLEDGGDAIVLENSYPVSRNVGLNQDPYIFTVTSSCEDYVGFNLYLATLSTNTLSDSAIHYVITENGSKDALVEGILSEAEEALSEFTVEEQTQLNIGINGTFGTIYKLYNDSIPLQGNKTYDLYLFIDEFVTNDTMNQVFSGGIAIKSYYREPLLVEMCSNIDNSNFLTCYIYNQYTGVDGDNGLYYHDGVGNYINASLEANDYSYRYSGVNPNNYVCFGTNESICPVDNLYRIIGIFGNNVKLIKADYTTSVMLGNNGTYVNNPLSDFDYYKGTMNVDDIALYRWDVIQGNDNYELKWELSQLNTINLNTNYLNYLGSWSNKIANSSWYVGGLSYHNGNGINAQNAFDYEVGVKANDITYMAKIGLMYISDYYYGASPNYWNYPGYNIDGNDYRMATNDNWIYLGLSEWTITPDNGNSNYYIFDVLRDGLGNSNSVNNSIVVRPCFYLNYDVEYISGDGSVDNPIRIN